MGPDDSTDNGNDQALPSLRRERRWGRWLVVVGVLAVLVVGYLLVRPDPKEMEPTSKDDPPATLERPPAEDKSESWCELPEGDWNAAAEPPKEAPWTAPYNLAAPKVDEIGPGSDETIHACFARNPLGAVLSAMWWIVDDENPAVDTTGLIASRVASRSVERAVAQMESEDGALVEGQFAGYRLNGSVTPDQVDVEVLLRHITDGGDEALVGIEIPVIWEGGDWLITFPDSGYQRTFPTSTDGYTLWSPPESVDGDAAGSVGRTAPLARPAPFAAADEPVADPPYNAREQMWADAWQEWIEKVPTDSRAPEQWADFAAMSHAERRAYITPDPPLTAEEREFLQNRHSVGDGECDGVPITAPCANIVNIPSVLHDFITDSHEGRAQTIEDNQLQQIGDGDGCGNAIECAVSGIQEAIERLDDTISGVADALAAISSFSPENIAEEWAREAAKGVVWVLDRITEATLDFASPAYEQDWWAQQYAVTYGLALIALAFMLVFVGAKIGGPNGPVSGVTLAREVVARIPWAVPIMAVAPAFMLEGQRFFAGLAEGIGEAGNDSAGSAAQQFIDGIARTADAPGDQSFVVLLGGGVVAMCLLFPMVVIGALVLVELAFAKWGASFFGLLVPLATVAWIYPPWRKALLGLAAFLVGIWAMPFAVNLVYWSTWSAVDAGLGNDLFNVLLYVLVGTFMLASAPILAPMILARMIPDYEGPGKGHAIGSTSGGSSTQSPADRYKQMSQRDALNRPSQGSPSSSSPGSAGGGGGGGGPAGGSGAGPASSPRPIPATAGPSGASGAAGASGASATSGVTATGASGGAAAGGSGAAAAGASVAGGVATGGVLTAAMAAKSISDKMRREAEQSRNRWLRS